MSDPRDQLKAMLQDLINNKEETADVRLHDYVVAKTQELMGLGNAPVEAEIPSQD